MAPCYNRPPAETPAISLQGKQNPGTPAGQRDQAASSQGENIPLQDMAPGSDQSQGGDVRPAARSRDDDAGSSQTVPRSASQIQRKTCSIM